MFLPCEVRTSVADALGAYLDRRNRPARIIAVGAEHAHVLFRSGRENAKRLIAGAKQSASRLVTDRLPGTIWGQGCHVVRVRDEEHYRAVVKYIADHEQQGASLWHHPSLRADRSREV